MWFLRLIIHPIVFICILFLLLINDLVFKHEFLSRGVVYVLSVVCIYYVAVLIWNKQNRIKNENTKHN